MKGELIQVMGQNFNGLQTDRLGNDLILIEDPYYKDGYDFPFSSNATSCIIVTHGSMSCVVDMKFHEISTQGLLIINSGQIVERIHFGEDFKGLFILMSASFGQKLELGNEYHLLKDINENGFFPLDPESIEAMIQYFRMLQGLLRTENPYKSEAAKHLTLAYLYGCGSYIHENVQQKSKNRLEEITNEFLSLVRENCRKHRDIPYYADIIGVSAKHLSKAVSATTGDKAMSWIERYTILNAKSLLKTTTFTISQISDILSFGTQSDFGKYFKKSTGMSPAQFRKN